MKSAKEMSVLNDGRVISFLSKCCHFVANSASGYHLAKCKSYTAYDYLYYKHLLIARFRIRI